MRTVPIRAVLHDEIRKLKPDTRTAICISNGIDSLSLAYALMDCGFRPTCYSFTLEGWASTDFKGGRFRAERLGLDWRPIFLPTDPEAIKADLLELASLGAELKTEFECGWPMLHVARHVAEHTIVTGHGAGSAFCLSKSGMMHFKHRLDDYREKNLSNPKWGQQQLLADLGARYSRRFFMPYMTRAMVDAFKGTTWDEINKPREKMAMVREFPEMTRFKLQTHRNYQLGDSNISATLEKILLGTNWAEGRGSVRKIYGALARGEIRET